MADQTQEVTETVTQGNGVVQRNQVVKNSDPTAQSKVEQVVYLLLGILEAVLGIRFVLSLLGANRANDFADLIYNVSYPFVAPFFGLFRYQFEAGVARLEIETIVAMAVYALVAWGIVQFVRIAKRG